jgi:hypothetical protein
MQGSYDREILYDSAFRNSHDIGSSGHTARIDTLPKS